MRLMTSPLSEPRTGHQHRTPCLPSSPQLGHFACPAPSPFLLPSLSLLCLLSVLPGPRLLVNRSRPGVFIAGASPAHKQGLFQPSSLRSLPTQAML